MIEPAQQSVGHEIAHHHTARISANSAQDVTMAAMHYTEMRFFRMTLAVAPMPQMNAAFRRLGQGG
ncbi:MAG: hypothetical protein MZV49_07715 [Rhodopseudomonas palustris]|nr:hypothetical protein [Rhodopseudomonas palustris]